LICQGYDVDPLRCSQSGERMKVIAVIERPAVIRQILEHLGLSTAAPSFRAPPDPLDGRGADPPREWSYELFFDDLPVPDPVRA
jgi:hypothetical protein